VDVKEMKPAVKVEGDKAGAEAAFKKAIAD
jgi:hypothetical protein